MEKKDLLFYKANGWNQLIEIMCDELDEIQFDYSKITYIKEKYGSIRIEAYGCNNNEESIIRQIEIASMYICMDCGLPGRVRTELGRWQCLCNKCLSDKNNKDELGNN